MGKLRIIVVYACLALALTGCSFASGPTLKPVKMLFPRNVMRGVPSPDGRWIAVTTGSGLYLLNLANGSSKTLVPGSAGELHPDVQWSSDATRLSYSLRTLGSAPRQFDGRNWPLIKIINIASGKTITIGNGFVWGWSPGGKRIAWNPMPSSPPARIVSDASTGRRISRVTAYGDRTPHWTKSEPKETIGLPDPRRPETWRDRLHMWVSPDGTAAIWEEWKPISDPSSRGGAPGMGWKPYLDGVWLGKFVGGRLQRRDKVLGPGPENDISSLIWFPDSTRALAVTEARSEPSRGLVSSLFSIASNGRVQKITAEKQKWIGFPRFVDSRKGVIVYCHREGGTIDKSSLWLGQLSGLK